MKKAILYTLKETEVVCSSYLRLITLSPDSGVPLRVGASEDFLLPTSEIKTLDLKPYHIRKCSKPRQPLIHPHNQELVYEDIFFYLEPALEEILKSPFLSEARELNREIDNLKKYREKVEDFNGLRWWKRVLISLKGISV